MRDLIAAQTARGAHEDIYLAVKCEISNVENGYENEYAYKIQESRIKNFAWEKLFKRFFTFLRYLQTRDLRFLLYEIIPKQYNAAK